MRAPTDLNVGDRLVSVRTATGWMLVAGSNGVMSIAVAELPGPMGMYLVASVTKDNGPDEVIPLHSVQSFEVLNP